MESVENINSQPPELSLPGRPVDRFIEPLTRFLHVESASGIVLLFVTLLALVLANSPVSHAYLSFWKTPLSLAIGPFRDAVFPPTLD